MSVKTTTKLQITKDIFKTKQKKRALEKGNTHLNNALHLCTVQLRSNLFSQITKWVSGLCRIWRGGTAGYPCWMMIALTCRNGIGRWWWWSCGSG
jgi:hypothetical protein